MLDTFTEQIKVSSREFLAIISGRVSWSKNVLVGTYTKWQLGARHEFNHSEKPN